MNNIVLIGAGQLGSRHLQSIKSTSNECNIWVVDSNNESLEICKERYKEAVGGENIKSIIFDNDYSQLPKIIDFLLIATNATPRFNIFSQITSSFEVKNILFEKVLFQKIEEYYLTLDIINKKSIKAWVNCPRRMFDIYHTIKAEIGSDKMLMTVDGGNWGMACNSIHFIDLYNFLSGNTTCEIDCSQLSNELLDSKRAGYKEFAGVLKITYPKKGELILSSRKQNSNQVIISISSDKGACVIAESEGKAILFKDKTSLEIPFTTPYQSQLTSIALDSILDSGKCDLIEYDTSMKLHLPFISKIISFVNNLESAESDICPIT